MKNLLLGAMTNYDYAKVQYWVNSIKETDFNGDIVVVVGNATKETVEKLGQKGCKIIAFQNDSLGNFTYETKLPMQTERFFHYWNFLKDHVDEYDLVLHTDMKDVVFQSNPFQWLRDTDYNTSVVATTECLQYEAEDWGKQNLIDTFGPYFYETFKKWEIYNVGVISGPTRDIAHLFLQIFMGSINRPVAICEQAVYNYLVNSFPWNDVICSPFMQEGFCAHLGTVMDPKKIEQFRPHLLEVEPKVDQEHVLTAKGDPFSIVHQYDRVPELKEYFESKFCDANQ